jgi:DNA gyrase/topoisomerase IV subunit A
MAIILMLFSIFILCWNLVLFQNENNMLKNELNTTKEECSELVNINSSMSEELESVRNELKEFKNKFEKIQNELEEVKKENSKWSNKYNQYPAATIAWIYMTEELKWSETVAAGIIGNMMSECGGQTLALNWDSNGSSGYGLIQWIGERRISIKEKYGHTPTIIEQIDFVKDELHGSNGVTQQVTDQQRELILNAVSPEQCAAEFARWFERPASKDYSVRQSNAVKAYTYFCEE